MFKICHEIKKQVSIWCLDLGSIVQTCGTLGSKLISLLRNQLRGYALKPVL